MSEAEYSDNFVNSDNSYSNVGFKFDDPKVTFSIIIVALVGIIILTILVYTVPPEENNRVLQELNRLLKKVEAKVEGPDSSIEKGIAVFSDTSGGKIEGTNITIDGNDLHVTGDIVLSGSNSTIQGLENLSTAPPESNSVSNLNVELSVIDTSSNTTVFVLPETTDFTSKTILNRYNSDITVNSEIVSNNSVITFKTASVGNGSSKVWIKN
jgi:hypothetical protein